MIINIILFEDFETLDIFGIEAAREIADRIEYTWQEDKEEDSFAR